MTIAFDLLVLHYIADFQLQTPNMAMLKSTFVKPLALHCLVYSLCFLPFYGVPFWAVTFVTHFATDFVTSKMTRYFSQRAKRAANPGLEWHWFFCVVGADQLIHYATLVWTLNWIASVS
jgi:hypothetical protein